MPHLGTAMDTVGHRDRDGTLEDMGSRSISLMEDSLVVAYGNHENKKCMPGATMKEILILLPPFFR